MARRQTGGGGVKRKKQDEDQRDSGGGEVKTPRRSPGTKRNSPPGPRIKPKHKEAPQLRGAVGDIRRWVVSASREGRELKDRDHKSRTQEDKNQRPQAPLEPRDGSTSRNLDPGSLQEATRKENSQDPPLNSRNHLNGLCWLPREGETARTRAGQERRQHQGRVRKDLSQELTVQDPDSNLTSINLWSESVGLARHKLKLLVSESGWAEDGISFS